MCRGAHIALKLLTQLEAFWAVETTLCEFLMLLSVERSSCRIIGLEALAACHILHQPETFQHDSDSAQNFQTKHPFSS